MQYYEKDDMVFAQSKRGFLQPAIVQKPSKDYESYTICFIGDNATKSEVFENLKDYNTETLDAYRKRIDDASA